MKFTQFTSAAAIVAAGAVVATGAMAQTRDQIRIVGSSTVFPYTQAVSEEYANATGNAAPVVESTGTGGGMKIFCEGVGPNTPDITGASRAMKSSEFELCASNGVTDITEVLIGFDGISIAVSADSPHDWAISEKDLYTALAAQVPVDGELVDNPYTEWSEVNPDAPDVAITVFGPPPTSGTRDAFVELAMLDGCSDYEMLAEMEESDEDQFEAVCGTMRTDGPFIEAGENDNLIVQRLQSDATALGIFGYSFLYENRDALKGVAVNGVEPTFETIASGDYDIARPLYFYIKNAHRNAIAGLSEFVEMYVDEAALGPDGYLKERGLTVLADEPRAATQQAALDGESMAAPQ